MTNPTLERAARAVLDEVSDWGWASAHQEEKDMATRTARAVLMAVREPDEAIKNAITIGGWMEQELKYDDVWQASIDAILSEKGSDDVC